MAEGSLEGFLCPKCMKDLRSPQNLISHFESSHSEEQDLLKSIKSIYGKAKKIFKLDEQDLEQFKKELNLERNFIDEEQEPGPTKSYTEYFKEIRRDRLEHRTTETNKLIIRLDRLLQLDGSDRKQHEQELVAWLDGTAVTRCPSCASSFNLVVRQHHCRLCGSIMCNSCSYFLSYETAEAIVTPVKTFNGREHRPSKESDSIRICHHCLDMLETRRRAQVEQMIQPIICQLYSHLQKSKQQIQHSVDMYSKMHSSISLGETTYALQDLHSLRTTIADNAQMIDTLSKKIASLPVDSDTPKAVALQNSIRKATSVYIKDYLLSQPPPPTLEELEQIKRGRSMKTDDDDELIPRERLRITKVTVATGWSPANVNNERTVPEEADPLLEQMNNVRSYIDQARKAHRYEEVASLEENLKMLKEMYRKQQQEASKGSD
nr:unnamed protein product [Callosobruchus chinensis]